MFSKHDRPDSGGPDAPARKRLRSNLVDLVASNTLSAERLAETARQLAECGAPGFQDLGVRPRTKTTHNAARDLRRRISQTVPWPEPYVFLCPVWDVKRGCHQRQKLHLWLPHEVLFKMHAWVRDPEALFSREELGPSTTAHVEEVEATTGFRLLPCGLWSDGVPVQWERTESLEVVSMNFPGLGGQARALRVPITALAKSQLAEDHQTWDAIFEVVSWSFRCLMTKRWPAARHDGGAWAAGDTKRARRAGQELPLRAVLAEVRGDWKMYLETFRFPGWRSKAGMCFLCKCLPSQVTLVGQDAPWRTQPLGHWEALANMHEAGRGISPLFTSPFLKTTCWRIDWLHCCDLGVAANFIRGLFYFFIHRRRIFAERSLKEPPPGAVGTHPGLVPRK